MMAIYHFHHQFVLIELVLKVDVSQIMFIEKKNYYIIMKEILIELTILSYFDDHYKQNIII